MTDLLGPANAVNTVTTRPADTRVFGLTDTWAKDATNSTSNDGTGWSAATFNGLLAQVRNIIRGLGVTVDNTNDNMLLQAVQTVGIPYAVDTGTQNALAVNLAVPGWTIAAGKSIAVKIANPVTGAATIALSVNLVLIGTYNITRADISALNPYDLDTGQVATLNFDGTQFQLPIGGASGRTGDLKDALAGTSLKGWVPLNGLTIGSASSSATGRANADCQQLFAFIYNNFSNTLCPVSGGRTSEAADWAANKTIQLPDTQCKTRIGVDGMGGAGATSRLTGVPVTAGAAATPGSTLGEALHTLATGEMPVHNHGTTESPHAHTFNSGNAGAGASPSVVAANLTGVTNNTPPTTAVATGLTVNNSGSGTAHNNTPLSFTVVTFARL